MQVQFLGRGRDLGAALRASRRHLGDGPRAPRSTRRTGAWAPSCGQTAYIAWWKPVSGSGTVSRPASSASRTAATSLVPSIVASLLDLRGPAGIEGPRGRTDDGASVPARLLGLRTRVYASGGGTDGCRPSAAPSPAKAGRAAAQTRHAETMPPGVGCDALVLIAATKPCPCGNHGDPRRACTFAPGVIGRYKKRQSIGDRMRLIRPRQLPRLTWRTRRDRLRHRVRPLPPTAPRPTRWQWRTIEIEGQRCHPRVGEHVPMRIAPQPLLVQPALRPVLRRTKRTEAPCSRNPSSERTDT